jgi:arylsulfatase A
MMRNKWLLLAAMLVAPLTRAVPLRAADAPSASKPNIVYILADDLGYGDVHCLGGDRSKIATPNIDRLASAGLTFTEAHSSSAVCSPSRYAILTGRYNWRTHLQKGVLGGSSPPLIAADRLTVPALLKQHGYDTACIGKWHLGMEIPKKPKGLIAEGPTTRGFDYFFGISASADMPPYAFIENDRFTVPPTAEAELLKGRRGPAAPHYTIENVLPTLVQKSKEWLGKHQDHPFFLYLALNSPHIPLAPTKEWRGKSGLGNYGDFVMETDWAVGEVMHAIDTAGLTDNTLFIFTSDNGCAPYIGTSTTDDPAQSSEGIGAVAELEAKGHFPSEWRRGYKTDIWDGGHRIPFIARWPARIKPGTQSAQLICLSDLLATCADIVGTKLPDNAGEDSVSILPALLGNADKPLRDAIVHHSGMGLFAIRQGNWKLELCGSSGGWSDPATGSKAATLLPPIQLYDMAKDIRERTNEYKEHPDIVARLTKLLEKYIADGRSTPGAPQKNDVPIKVWKEREPGDKELEKIGD